jgi:peptide/nickel transport system substrate-binding protein
MLAAGVVSACSSSSSNSGSSSGGVLNVGMPDGAQTDNNNPLLASSAASNLGYRYMIYEPLEETNPTEPSKAATPWLATAAVWSNNFQKLVLTIRSGVKWSDGTPLTSADVAYTFQLLKNNAALNADAIQFGSITASGSTVTLTFPSSQYVTQDEIINQLIVQKAQFSKMSNPATNTLADPIGTGPYSLKSFTSQTVTLSRNSSYWQSLPAPATIHYSSYTDNNTQTTALTSGAVDWSYVFIPNPSVTYTAKDPAHLKLWFPPVLGIHGLYINTTQAPYNNVALRQAMADVINKSNIVKEGEDGYFYSLVSNPTGIPTPAGNSYISSQYANQSANVDVAKAKNTLTSAGFTFSGNTLKDPSGNAVTLTLADPAGWSDYDTDMTLIQSDLAQIGINVSVQQPNSNAWTTNVNDGDFQAVIRWTNNGQTPWNIYDTIMDGTYYEPIGTTANGDFGRFQDAAATTALNQYANASSDATRTQALNTLEQIMVTQVPMIPLMAGTAGAEYSTKAWSGWPDASNDYAAPQPTLEDSLLIVLKLKAA